MKTTCNLGDVVAVVFDDHSEGQEYVVFEVFGTVLRKDRKSLLIGSFVYAASSEIDENVVVYTILRAAIRKLEVLRKAQKITQPV